MCWRWEVSLVSAIFEWSTALYLCRRNSDRRERPYAHFIASIALMETGQGLLWAFALDNDSDQYPEVKKTTANFLLSLLIWFSAWVHVPLTIVNFGNYKTSIWRCDPEIFSYWKVGFFLYFLGQAFFVLMAQMATKNYYTRVGENGHQVWPCGPGLGELLGDGILDSKLDNRSAVIDMGSSESGHQKHIFHLCTIVCLLYVTMLFISAYVPEQLPKFELSAWALIGVASFIPVYITLGPTMEACSTWCWMAGGYSLLYLARPFLIRAVIEKCPKSWYGVEDLIGGDHDYRGVGSKKAKESPLPSRDTSPKEVEPSGSRAQMI